MLDETCDQGQDLWPEYSMPEGLSKNAPGPVAGACTLTLHARGVKQKHSKVMWLIEREGPRPVGSLPGSERSSLFLIHPQDNSNPPPPPPPNACTQARMHERAIERQSDRQRQRAEIQKQTDTEIGKA